jgi:hypothetical protein
MANISFYEKYKQLGSGSLFSYPIPDTAILAYSIDDCEMEPFMNPSFPEYSKFADKSWSFILDEILDRRKTSK